MQLRRRGNVVAQVPDGWLAAPGLCCNFNMHRSHYGAPGYLVPPERQFIATLACIVPFRPGGAGRPGVQSSDASMGRGNHNNCILCGQPSPL